MIKFSLQLFREVCTIREEVRLISGERERRFPANFIHMLPREKHDVQVAQVAESSLKLVFLRHTIKL